MSADETPAPRRPEPGSIEDMVFRGLVDQFFEPRMTGWHLQQVPDGRGGWDNHPVPSMIPSPLSTMAIAMFDTYKIVILEAIWEQVDLDDLAGKIAEQMVKKISDLAPDYSFHRDGSIESRMTAPAKEIRTKANEIVANTLAQRALERMDADQDGAARSSAQSGEDNT